MSWRQLTKLSNMANGPVDSRLLRYASAARFFLVAGAILSLAQIATTIGFAWGVASGVSGAVSGQSIEQLSPSLALIVVSVSLRALILWLMDFTATRGAAKVKSQLRMKVMSALARLGPRWMATQNSAHLTTVVGRGLEALDPYFSRYLPQLILTALATPLLVIVLFFADFGTGLTVLITLPLIPIFMILIGWATKTVQAQQWRQLTSLSSGFLDVVEGLSTLKIFGRAHRQSEHIESLTEDYRQRTMKVLRVSFLSGFALELIASLSVALVAVSIGIRLIDGTLALAVGLFALLLTPEAYLPLRNVGAQFHAAAEGVAAADDVFDILDAAAGTEPHTPRAQGSLDSSRVVDGVRCDDREHSANGREFMVALSGPTPATNLLSGPAFNVRGLTVRLGERLILDNLTASFPPGQITAVTGVSGAGKTTLVNALMGFVSSQGDIGWGDTFFTGNGVARSEISWAPQSPSLVAGTLLHNITLGSDEEPNLELVRRACGLAAFDGADLGAQLGTAGAGLSGGQAHRVAMARAYYRALTQNTPILVLDEPTSALDAATEARVIDGMKHWAHSGHTVIVVSHRPCVIASADSICELVPVSDGVIA